MRAKTCQNFFARSLSFTTLSLTYKVGYELMNRQSCFRQSRDGKKYLTVVLVSKGMVRKESLCCFSQPRDGKKHPTTKHSFENLWTIIIY